MSETNSNPELSIVFGGDFMNSSFGIAIASSMRNAMAIKHKLPRHIVEMQGMSGKKYRYFINNLISLINNPSYLEIGSWAGSTACSAIYGNKINVLCIDNWSEFGGPKEQFLKNISELKNQNLCFKFIESDFRLVNFIDLEKFNVYLFDGPHSEQDQYDGIKIALPALQNDFIIIVDDWNWDRVRKGTFRALRDTKIAISSFVDIRTSQDNTTPEIKFERSEWHNGYFIAACQKSNQPYPLH